MNSTKILAKVDLGNGEAEWESESVKRRTERPERHGSRAADELGVLIQDSEWRRPGEEVEIEGAADDAPREERVAVFDIHAIAIEQEHAVRDSPGAHVQVERVRAVEVYVRVHGADVRRPQGVRLALHERQPVRARALAQPEQRRVARRQVRRELQVLVLEHQRVERLRLHAVTGGGDGRRGVEEDLVVGDARHGEPERVGSVRELDERLLRQSEAIR